MDSEENTPLLNDDSGRWDIAQTNVKLFFHKALLYVLKKCVTFVTCLNHVVLSLSSLCSLSFPSSDDSQNDEYKSRWRSIRVMYFTMFLSSVGKHIWYHLFYPSHIAYLF